MHSSTLRTTAALFALVFAATNMACSDDPETEKKETAADGTTADGTGADTGGTADGSGDTSTVNDTASDAATDAGSGADTATGQDTAADTATANDTAQTDAGSTDAVAPVDAGPVAPTCEQYCTAIMANCTGAMSQYKDEATCLSTCKDIAKFPVGTADDKGGNTVGCRTYHAGAAKGDAKLHCPHAGPTGGNVCGNWCENYCHLSKTNCSGDLSLYKDDLACMDACKTADATGLPGASTGTTLQCSIYHLTAAGSNAKLHCPHGSIPGKAGDPCGPVPSCDAYCTDITANCSGDMKQYADKAACMAYCSTTGKLPLGSVEDKAGNTVGCRTYHAGAAKSDAKLHCPHAGPTGGNVCGSWCDNYCHLSKSNCAGDLSLYKDDAACMTQCKTADDTGVPGAFAGPTLQCHIYHLGAAGSDAKLHCPHGTIPGKANHPCSEKPACEAYCKAITANCTGEMAQYKDEATCISYCKDGGKIPLGTTEDKGGNTVGCRTYHAGAAKSDAKLHCPHAGPTGGNVCGSWCENYCQLGESNCTGAKALYTDNAACMDKCKGVSAVGLPGDATGATVQCYIYHMGAAGSDATLHCPHGVVPNAAGGPCLNKS